MNDRMPDDKPTRVPARASQWWNSPSAIDLASTEGLTAIRGDRAKSALLLEREPTDRKAGCGKSARPVWREGRPNSIGRPYPDQIRKLIGPGVQLPGHVVACPVRRRFTAFPVQPVIGSASAPALPLRRRRITLLAAVSDCTIMAARIGPVLKGSADVSTWASSLLRLSWVVLGG